MTENTRLLLIGDGGLLRTLEEIARSMDCFEHIDLLGNDVPERIGGLDDYEALSSVYRYAFSAWEDNVQRAVWMDKLKAACYLLPVLVHPKAAVSPSAQLQENTAVGPVAAIGSDVVLCRGVLVEMSAVIDQNAFLGDCCRIGSGAVIPGGTVLPAQSIIEAGRLVQGRRQDSDYSFEVGV